MKTKTLLMSALVLAVLAACDRQADAGTGMDETAAADTAASADMPQADSPADQAQGPANGAMDAPAATSAEAGLLGLLMVVNDHEIAAAEQARGKEVDGPTLDYANLMHEEHSKNQTQTRALMGAAAADGADSSEAAAQKQKGEAERAALEPLAKEAYEKGYIDAMVKGHTEVLAMLDSKLIPGATTPAVQQHLTMTREHVAMHLEKARELQAADTR